ncbi:MAG: 50S ribosomal protein L24 [Bacteroidia bacterium]|nr:50S ribosomal protein L24 [Bacteroidia bacterium]MCF8427809.1 50S ribosomal protein L24 [Bacteroidia bacterium]MCF8446047.1 50S ribosomal protein L24 [Bacteroidia bacterium]
MERKFNSQTKLHVKKGDMVQIIAGDDKGKKGRVIEVITDSLRALVEGINIVSRHTKPNAQNQNGGIIKKEAPVHISNLKVVDKAGNATRVGRKTNEKGKLARVSKKSGEFID